MIVGFEQAFYWNQQDLEALKSLNAHYQWELRRPDDKDYWDYWRPGLNCYNTYYWTNLPDSSSFWSEEVSVPPGCPFWIKGNEEFEVKSRDTQSLIPNFDYSVQVSFLRKVPDNPIEITTKSEYCGKIPGIPNWCIVPNLDRFNEFLDTWNPKKLAKFGYHEMNKTVVIS